MKKRIGVIMYQTSRSKGQELVAQRMVKYFRKAGEHAYLITSAYHDGKELVNPESIGEKGYVNVDDEELGIPVIRVGSFTSRWPPRRVVFKDEVHTLERIVNDFQLNVLITHSTLWNGPEEVAKFVEWRRNIKELGGYQDPLVFCHMSHFQEPSAGRYSLVERSFRLAWNKLSLKTILRVANLILVVTPYEEEAKVKMGAPRKKCLLFAGGVDDNSFISFATSNPEELRRRLNFPPETKLVVYMGTIEPRKNPKAVLDVAEELKNREDIRFVIAGRGDSEYAEEVRQRAKVLANVTYLGEITEKEKAQLIESSYLNILLSRMEALGLAQLEFMFRGVPVITSGVGGQDWLIRNGQEGIHVEGPDDVEGAARAIVDLVDEHSKWERLSANAKARGQEFTLTKLISTLDEAITEEVEKETGLSKLSGEVRSTLSEPEVVMRNWSHGTRKLTATNRRIFIQEGKISKRTLEIPYPNIRSIGYVRRYNWRALLIGAILSGVLFTQHYFFPVISRTLTSKITAIVTSLLPNIKPNLPQVMGDIWLIPVSLGFLWFLTSVRKGYALDGAAENPIYLPSSFHEAIEFIREKQGQTHSSTKNDSADEPANSAQPNAN